MRLPPEQIERFHGDLDALGGVGRLGIAVSGGPDSLALLLLANAALPGRVEAATIDHGLRPESRDEAAFVARVCADLGCPHAILPVQVPGGPGGLQSEARTTRYAALAAWAGQRELPALATAHHADDQAETLLMRLRRGSGLAGLSGIRPSRPLGDLRVLRPLLQWSRAELAAIVSGAGVQPIDDPSNRDLRFDRSAMRDFLAANRDFEPARLARSAAALREADEALAWAADRLAAERLRCQGEDWLLDPSGLPRDLTRRLLHRAIAGIIPGWSDAGDVEGLLSALEAGGAGTRAGVAARGGTVWRLRAAPPRRPTRA